MVINKDFARTKLYISILRKEEAANVFLPANYRSLSHSISAHFLHYEELHLMKALLQYKHYHPIRKKSLPQRYQTTH